MVKVSCENRWGNLEKVIYLSRHSPCHGETSLACACTYHFPVYLGVTMLRRTHWMEFLTYGDTSNPYFPLIHHLMRVKKSFYHTSFTAISYTSDLSQVATSKPPNRAKHDFLSLRDSSLFVQCGKTLPRHSVHGACLSFTPNLQTDFPFVNQQTPLYLALSWL